eukprot:tig00000180_g13611.t1
MGERGDGDEAPEEAPPPPPPSAIDENLSQRALYEAMGVMSGVLAVPGGRGEKKRRRLPSLRRRTGVRAAQGLAAAAAVLVGGPTYANDHKLLREYMTGNTRFPALECYSQGSLNGNAARDQLPLRWQHAGDVDEYNVDVLTLQDSNGRAVLNYAQRVGPAARGIVNWFSLVGPPQRPFDEDPELFDLQGLHSRTRLRRQLGYRAVPRGRTRTAQSAVPTYTGAWDLTHEAQPTHRVFDLGQDAVATRFARDVAVLALLRPLADKRVENVEGRLQTRRIYAPRLVAGTATPAPNAACDKDVAGGAPHQRENKSCGSQ